MEQDRRLGLQLELLKKDKARLLSQLTAQESVIDGLRAERRIWGQELAQQGGRHPGGHMLPTLNRPCSAWQTLICWGFILFVSSKACHLVVIWETHTLYSKDTLDKFIFLAPFNTEEFNIYLPELKQHLKETETENKLNYHVIVVMFHTCFHERLDLTYNLMCTSLLGVSLAQDRGRLEARIEVLSTELETQKKQNERDNDALKIKAKIVDDQTETIRKLKEVSLH